jgi:hypothetical protein
MKSFLKVSLFFISFFFFQNLFAALSPVGFWKTIDDETGKPKAVIQIWQAANDTLNGRILKIWPRPGYDQNEKCQACTGSRRNQRIVGMVVLQDLRQSNDSPAI